jgi:hypothetical protein
VLPDLRPELLTPHPGLLPVVFVLADHAEIAPVPGWRRAAGY